jgi:hypothetical protein
MTTPHPQVVRLARELCDSRYGAGHYDKPRTHRRYWCRKALAVIERGNAIAVADAFFGIFGMRRTEQ